ncbi:MAG: glutamate--tRNA ligase [Burkholderiales bacterium]|nr:glutamate--tRNA ligase [Phycisphaerae bacterium]
MPTVVTRFAPSPTGYLHVGGARTALFNWLLARNTGGRFLLRIEDTDLARSTDDATRQLLEDLAWLGLKWDNQELVYQSKRLDIYNKLIDGLIEKNLAYQAWETNVELDAMRAQAQKAKRPFIYRRRQYSDDELKRFKDEGRAPIIRFQMPVKEFRFHDVGLDKECVQGGFESQDFVIRKTDGMPTYHFGVVVDDAEMGVTHVLRGLEHLKNTFNHISLQEALGYERPIYAHLSVMLNPENGDKLSKRDRDRRIRKRVQEWMRSTKKTVADVSAACGLASERIQEWIDTDTIQLDLTEQPKVMSVVGLKETDLPEIMIHDFRKNGYAPEVLNNFLALQGWSPGHDLEQMTIEQMVEKFSLTRIISANPKFNRDKLKSFSTDFFAKATPERLLAAMRDYLVVNPSSPLNQATDAQLSQLLAMNAGFHVLAEVDEKSRFFFTPDAEIAYDPAAVEKVLIKGDRQGAIALQAVRELLAGLPDWSAGPIEAALKQYCEQTQLGLGKVAQPIRVGISGSTVSPPIFDSLVFLGRERTLSRIDRCLRSI